MLEAREIIISCVTVQFTTTVKWYITCNTVSLKFDEFTVKVKLCGPRSLGETRRFLSMWIIALVSSKDIKAEEELKLEVIGQTIEGYFSYTLVRISIVSD